MNKTFYNCFRDNFLHNFLEKYYKYTTVSNKKILFNDLQDRCPFKISVKDNNYYDDITVDTGDNIYLFRFTWEIRPIEKINNYHLINILKIS